MHPPPPFILRSHTYSSLPKKARILFCTLAVRRMTSSGFSWAIRVLSRFILYMGVDSEMCLFNVDGGQRAVIFDRFQGVKEAVVGEGTHFMIPVIQRPIIVDIRARPRTINSITGTKDLQMANISLRVLSRPLEAELPRIYQELGTDFDDRVLPSLGNEVSGFSVHTFSSAPLRGRSCCTTAVFPFLPRHGRGNASSHFGGWPKWNTTRRRALILSLLLLQSRHERKNPMLVFP